MVPHIPFDSYCFVAFREPLEGFMPLVGRLDGWGVAALRAEGPDMGGKEVAAAEGGFYVVLVLT